MKTIITSVFSFCLLPILLPAQPTISTNEFYNAGDVIQMVNCDTTGLNAGAPGANITWDFSLLSASGGYAVTSVVTDTSSAGVIANIEEVLPNGAQEYIQETSTDSYENGSYDPSSGTTTYYTAYDIARRPITYNTTYADTYHISVASAVPVYGEGTLVQTCDAYGTIILPGGLTFSNVLRVKKIQYEADTVSPTDITGSSITSYLWFDGVHHAPLVRIDSISNIDGQTRSIMYLAAPESVPAISSNPLHTNAWFDNNSLRLTGNFEESKSYEVVVYDMIGAKIFTQQFTGSGNQRFDIDRQIAPGIYIVSITDINDPSSPGMIKIVKH